jgi:hypothetical protein
LRACLETEYRVLGPRPFVPCIGRPGADVLARHQRHGAECSAFITACNPFSQPVSGQANGQRQARLARSLTVRGLAFEPRIGQHPASGWPGEPSFLVCGLGRAAARHLGAELPQSAIVWVGADGVPQLEMLAA